jgi:hypothetical protein
MPQTACKTPTMQVCMPRYLMSVIYLFCVAAAVPVGHLRKQTISLPVLPKLRCNLLRAVHQAAPRMGSWIQHPHELLMPCT